MKIDKYTYKCSTCDKEYSFFHPQSYKNCKACEDKGELRLKSILHDDVEEDKDSIKIHIESDKEYEKRVAKIEGEIAEDEEPEMPEDGWECSECGAPVNNMNDVCSRSCFNAMMR